jgi:heme-degrading monooxygenase HmoA
MEMQIPYYAVIFTSKRKAQEGDGYQEMAVKMDALARAQPGFLGIDSVSSVVEGKVLSYFKYPLRSNMSSFRDGRTLGSTIRDHRLVLERRE